MRREAERIYIQDCEESFATTEKILKSIKRKEKIIGILEKLAIVLLYAFAMCLMFYAGTIYGGLK